MKKRESIKKFRFKAATVITLFFVVFVGFAAPNSLWKTYRLRREINGIRREQARLREGARADSIFIENLKDDEFLEKYARERFYMKRKGEEIYLIEEE